VFESRRGTTHTPPSVTDVSGLICYRCFRLHRWAGDTGRLGMELHRGIDVALRLPRVATDRRFCEQIRDASTAVPANIAEGFGRYGTRELLRFLGIARGSLADTQTWLLIGRDRGHLSHEQCDQLMLLSNQPLAR
jgi:four helix bundle protein